MDIVNKGLNLLNFQHKGNQIVETYEIEFCTAFLGVEVVALEVREGDDEVDQDEEQTTRIQQAKRKQKNVSEKSHL